MDSEAYWAKRSEEREAAWQLKSRETLEKKLAAYYEASLDHIQRNIDALYGRFAKDNALPMEEARKLLTGKEYRTWRMSLEEYVAQIDAGDKMLERELNTLAMRSRISRLDKLYSETLMELDGLGRKMRDRMDGFLGDAYKDNYYRGLYEIGHVGKALPAISQVDSKSVEAVLRTPWSGKNYSARIWKNQKQLAQVIQDEVVASVHRGDDVRKISRRVADKMGVGLSNAQRLVRTELNYVHNQAALDSIRDAEMDYFRFVATLDSRTSTMCREHDGKIYPIDDADTGENIPPLHPRCRSIIVGSLGGRELKGQTRIAKGDEGKYIHVPAEMTYEDFQAVYVEKTQTVDEWKEIRTKKRSITTPTLPDLPKTVWPEPGSVITKTQYKELQKVAAENGIRLSGFKVFDGDVDLVKEVLVEYGKLANQYVLPEKVRKNLTLSVLEDTDSDALASTPDKYTISLNAAAFRNKKALNDEYNLRLSYGLYPKGTTYRNIIVHEFGHILDLTYGVKANEIVKRLTGINSIDNYLEWVDYISSNLSNYAAAYQDGSEILSEALNAFHGKAPSAFVLRFLKECDKIFMRGD